MKTILTILMGFAACYSAYSQCTDINKRFTDSVARTTAYFNDRSEAINGWVIDNRRWDFGDGSADSVIAQPYHSYTLPGIYTVQLAVSAYKPGRNGDKEFVCTETISQTVQIVSTGIEDIDGDGLTIYPNPSNGYISIKRSENIKNVYIYNMSGQLLSQTNNVDGLIELPNNMNNDSYMVRVEMDTRDVVKRVLMVR